MLQEIREIVDERASYGYRRAWGILRQRRRQRGECGPNHEREYRVMKANSLLLERSNGAGFDRRHDGKIAVAESDLRWCSDGLTIPRNNGEAVVSAPGAHLVKKPSLDIQNQIAVDP